MNMEQTPGQASPVFFYVLSGRNPAGWKENGQTQMHVVK